MSYETLTHKGSLILNRINSNSHISLRYIRILSSHVRLVLPKGLFSVGLPATILKALLPSSILVT